VENDPGRKPGGYGWAVTPLPGKSGILSLSLSPQSTVQIKIFKTPAEFREWLEENHDRASEIWLGFHNQRTDSGKYSFESRPKKLPLVYQRQFKANRTAWEFFMAQAPWYQRTSIFWVVSAKQEETRQRRLATLISDSEQGRRLSILTPKPKKTQDS
jgi:uncharacterized protein YdeI (YjbR/CyaY-like superfamily)